jgi:carboxyl-terminal processing protease
VLAFVARGRPVYNRDGGEAAARRRRVPTPTTPPETGAPSPTAIVCAAVEAVHARFYEPLAVADLFRDAWEGAAAALARAGVAAVPLAPAFPADVAAASSLHAKAFPALERLAVGRLDPAALNAAALRELLARRRDGHTCLITPRMSRRPPPGPRGDLGLVLTDAPPLTVADVRPRGPAQLAGLRRGQAVLAINGQPCADLRRFEATALLDRRSGAPNRLTVRDPGGGTREVESPAAPWPRISAEVLPGHVGLLRINGFAATDEEQEELRASLTSFEEAGAGGWIVDVRWCSGGFSGRFSRLLVDRGHLFARLRHDTARFPDGTAHPAREDIDADGSALPFQRPLVILVGPGSLSGAESFAGPLQALGRATLVGERTAGLCGYGSRVELAPGWAMSVAARETVFGPQERRFNRIGVPPDVAVSPTPDDEAAGRDPQLQAALRLLGSQATTP